ncbi:TPA: choice-of-anchor K domain-containing protein, partial [Aeromonas sobria]|nr:choice-of-anchor K domain-containing protein [Aeromonas sobria]
NESLPGSDSALVLAAPATSGGYANGDEYTLLTLKWVNFNASDTDTPAAQLSIKITSLPADGVLQYNGVTVTQAQINTGLTISKAEIDSGKLQFKPDLHESSDVAGNGGGNTVGNKAGDYASFNYQVSDGSSLSTTGKFVVDIAAVADKPILTLNNFQTVASLDFEDVNLGGSEWRADVSINSVQGASTVGVWNTLNSGGKVEVGTEKTYKGGTSTNKVMEIEANVGDKTLYTDINCEAGRFYQLGFDVAARLGNPATSDMTIKLVRLDASGNPISGTEKLLYNFDPTDSNWLRNQTVSLPIDASGKYRLIFEAVNADSTGAILDNIKFQAVENKGYEDNFIKLSAINASFSDKDGSETHSVTISGLMAGSILKDGAGKEVTVDATGKVDITTGWSLNSLMVKPPLHFSGDMKLLVTATAIETSNGSKESTVLELPVTVLPINDAPVIVSGVAVVSEEGLPGGLPDSIGNPSDQSNSKEMSGQLSISDEDGDALNVVLVKPIGVFSSGNQPVTWEGDNSKTLIAKAGGQTVAQITIDDAGNYKVTLLKPFDHPNGNGENVLSFDVGVKVTAGGQSTNGKLTVIVEDDSPLAIADDAKVDIVVDSFKFSGVEASWINVVGGKNLELFDGSDNDSAKDQVRWGGSSGDKSGYGFADNDAALNGEIPLNEEIKLGTFTHYNNPIDSGTGITSAAMKATFSVTDSMGRVTPVTVTINFNHNETPNDDADPRDIITIGTTTASFNFEGKVYSLEVLGFRDAGGNVVKTIYTNENASNSFDLIVKLVEGAGYQLPQTTGNVLANDLAGADGGLSVIGYGIGSSSTTYTNGVGVQVVGLYGVLTILANGAYTYQVTKNGSQIPADAREVFSYSVRDGDGDTTNSTLSISVNPVDSNGVPVHLPLTVDGTDLNDSILVRNGENTVNPDLLNVSFGGNLLGEIITSSGGTAHVHTDTSYNKGSADQVVSSGAGNYHVETGSGNDVIYAGKTGANGFGTDDSLQLTEDQLKNHHIMTGGLSGSNAMLNGDGLLLSVDVSSHQADVVNSGSGNDKIYGQSGSDILFGHTGDDYIDGGSHNDALRGGLGNDILIGGLGNDVLRGDEGADTFVWNKGDTVSGALTKDYIMDFNKGSGTINRLEGDKLDLSDLLDHDGSRNQNDLKSLLSVLEKNDGVHLFIREDSSATAPTQEIVLMNHSFNSLTGGSGVTANQVIDYMLNNNLLDIDK